jgi:hypothetical protein
MIDLFLFSSWLWVGEVPFWCSTRLLPSPVEVEAIETFDTIFNNDAVWNHALIGVDRAAS